ncbi:MAG: hypothetical protein KKA05_06735 [Alphaproteobacteria bacterium]|nr:hypothetical protein [Alphaproteobacteria bacterium]MBU0858500.1 hypothetical protein [Alphaproteobacteria bacterium]
MHKKGFGHTGPRHIGEGELKWQVRINLSAEFADAVRANPADASLKPLMDVLTKYNANIKNSGMSFADFLPYFMQEEMPQRLQQLDQLAQAFKDANAKDDVAAGIAAMQSWKKANEEMTERMGLFLWTKETMLKPETHAKYATRFTIFADGGKEVYDKAIADALEADLTALMASGMVTKVNKFDSDPAHNPQAPNKFRLS